MSTQIETPAAAKPLAGDTFARIVVGIDGSPASTEAARQAAALAGAQGEVDLIAAWSPLPVSLGAPAAVAVDAETRRQEADDSLRRARLDVAPLADARAKAVHGVAWDVLAGEATNARATLIAVGSHGHSRAQGIIIGSTATELVHKAPCSVLVARPATAEFPRSIVVGVDGSPEAARAYAVAAELAERLGASLWPVAAGGGKGLDRDAVVALLGHHFETSPDEPVGALVAAAAEADLVVVGSRGLHGFKALGSVSERVAHRARCSTLVVRDRTG